MTEKYRFTDNERALLESSPVPFAVYQFIDRQVTALILSDGFCELFGYTGREQAYSDMNNDMYKDTHPDDCARIADAALSFATGGADAKYDVLYRSKRFGSDSYEMIHAKGKHVYTATGERLAYVWYTAEGIYSPEDGNFDVSISDSLRSVLHEETLLKNSHYDLLTGLPAMAHFFELAAARREALLAEGGSPALLFMDLCRMKYFNNKHGFAEGDKLLQAFARVLSKYFGSECCCRIGEDHFAAVADEKGLRELLKDLFEECRWINGGLSLPVHTGIYLNSTEAVDAGTACYRAKLACDSLLSTYSSEMCFYDSTMRESEENRQHIIGNIDKAVNSGWITVYYQPIVRAVNGRVCDEEALARWIDPVKGFMSPAEFIPALENSGLIYKLDLYILDQVLKKLKTQRDAGLHLVPQSVNLSRSDFETCDIVEEIRSRVDASGLGRELITIEITESIIGSDFDFMKEQVERFRSLGFAVWMDDFGSGYSSLDVLQSIRFDLIKFDMRFLQTFNEGESGKIILTQLMKMTTFLGIDTVCEGVETEEQAHFLREIGCSKLQGYYYARPMPLSEILERYEKGIQIGFENPAESRYFESIGRINLHDLAVITQDGNGGEFNNYFDTLPMAIVELTGDKLRIARSNQSYRDFIGRYLKPEETTEGIRHEAAPMLVEIIKRCSRDSSRAFVDVRMPDNATVHYFVRCVDIDPLSGTIAVVVVVLTIKDANGSTDYENIARALAADYFRLYYVDIETEDFIEYSSGIGKEELAVKRHGKNFFFESRKVALETLYTEDREAFLEVFRKENVLRALERQGTFTLTYRLLQDGEPVYVNMKAMPMQDKKKHIIIGISNINTQMKQKEMYEKIDRERTAYAFMAALSGNYICMYTVDPETGRYREYSSSDIISDLGIEKSGHDFFASAQTDGERTVCADDLPLFRRLFTKENVMDKIQKNGIFSMNYRFMINGEPKPVSLRAALVDVNGSRKLIVGVSAADGGNC